MFAGIFTKAFLLFYGNKQYPILILWT